MKILIVLCSCLAVQVSAQPLSLPDAINLALQKNYDLRIARNVVDINRINNHIGTAGGLPTVSGNASDQESVANINQRLNTGTEISRTGAAVNALNANVTGSQLLYNGFRVRYTKNRLEVLQQQSEQQLAAQIQNTIAGVMVRYYDVVRQQRYILTLQQSIGLSEKQLEIVQAKQNVGLANNADLFQSQIDLNTRKQDLQAQQLALSQAQTDLLAWLDVEADSTVVITDSILLDQNVQLAAVLSGLPQNPEITILNQEININELIEKEVAAQRYPSLRANAGINYGRNQSAGGQLLLNQSYGPFIGLSLAVPIYNGGIFKRQQQTASIVTQNSRLQRENVLLDYRALALRTYQAYASSLQQIETQQNTYDISAQLVNLSLQRFELAAATIIELREAQKSFEDAAFRLVDLRYTAKLAEIELKRLQGQLRY